MSHPRVVTSRIAILMTGLVINSVVAYAAGKEPAIFAGPVFFVLLAAWLVCVGTWFLAERDHRAGVRQRANDYRLWLMIDGYPTRRDSGSGPRPD